MKLSLVKTLMILLPSLLIVDGLKAQEQTAGPLALSLKQAQDYAIRNSTNARNAAIDLELAKKKIWETTAIGLPQVNLAANYQHLFSVPELSIGGSTFLTTDLPSGTAITSDDITNEHVSIGYTPLAPIPLGVKDNTTFNLSVSQLVFSGEYLVGLQASKVYYLMSDQNQAKTESDLKESVANSYSLVLVLGQSDGILKQSLENLNTTLSEMREMYKQGFIENTDVDQIELTTLNLQNSINSLDRQIEAAQDLLKFQMGMPFDSAIVLTDNLETLTGAVTIETLLNQRFIVGNNIDYQILETQEKLGKLNLRREQSGYLPSLAAVYQHTEQLKNPEFNFTPKDVVALSLSFPIFTSGQRIVKVQQRRLELQKITNAKENVASGLQLDFTNSLNDLSTAYETFLNSQKNIDLTKRIYDKTLIKYKEGISSSLDLTNAQSQYLKALGDYYNANYALITAKNKLDKLNNNQ